MATLLGALGNIKKYGLGATLKGSFENPGGLFSYGSKTAGGKISPTQLSQSMPSLSNPFSNLSRSSQVSSGQVSASTPNVTTEQPTNVTTTPQTQLPSTQVARTAPRQTAQPVQQQSNPIVQAASGDFGQQPYSPFTQPNQLTQPQQGQSLGFFQGREYFDPSELYTDQLTYLDSIYGTNLAQLRQSKTRQLDTYGRQRGEIQNSLADLLAGYDTQEQQGLGNISTYYSNLGDIYQSSQGTRENELRGQVETARGKGRNQANENMSALERAIQEYLGDYGQAENELATGYQGARDEIGGRVASDLGNRLNIRDLVGQGIQTDLGASDIDTNNSLIASLQGLRGSRFGNQTRNATGNVNPILQYLSALA